MAFGPCGCLFGDDSILKFGMVVSVFHNIHQVLRLILNFAAPMKNLPILLLLLLSSTGIFAQTDSCNLLIHKSIKDEFVKSTRRETIYNVPNRTFGIFVQNRNGSMQMVFDWTIGLKALDATEKFEPKKPILLTFFFKDGSSHVITVEEYIPGSGAKQVRYAYKYTIGGSAFITAEDMAILTKLPIVNIRESIYGIPFDDTTPLRADYLIRAFKCVQP
jgi:hypothetical protein